MDSMEEIVQPRSSEPVNDNSDVYTSDTNKLKEHLKNTKKYNIEDTKEEVEDMVKMTNKIEEMSVKKDEENEEKETKEVKEVKENEKKEEKLAEKASNEPIGLIEIEEGVTIESNKGKEEIDGLQEMRKQLESELEKYKDYKEISGGVRLLRFLRGCNYKIPLAVQRYKDMINWRDSCKADEIRNQIVSEKLSFEDLPFAKQALSFVPVTEFFDIFDVNGNCVTIERTGYINVAGLTTNITEEDWTTFCISFLEYRAIQLDRVSRETKKVVRCTIVRDLKGLSVAHSSPTGLKYLKKVMSLGSAHYPESVSCMIILNAPWIFATIWKIISTWLDENQKKKVQILPATDMSKLYLTVPKEKLPENLGGTNTSIALPVAGLLLKSPFDTLLEAGGTESEINAGSCLQVPFTVKTGDILYWEYATKELDVEFSIKYRTQQDGGAQEIVLVQPRKITSNTMIQTGFYNTREHEETSEKNSPGAIVIVWNNSYSWTKKKRIVYKMRVEHNTGIEKANSSASGSLNESH